MINTLQIFRNELTHLVVPIDESTRFRHVVMGEHVIVSSFISPAPLDIDEGDYLMFRGDRYTINRPLPPYEKSSNFTYKYDLEFEGYIYDLWDMPYMHLGALEFSYYGTPAAFLQIAVDCMNQISSGWTVGIAEDLPEQLVDFFASGKGYTCKGGLMKAAEVFKLELWLTGKTINLTKQAGVQTNLFFEYGRGKGLYKVTRGKIDDQSYFNRIYIQGGDKNIPASYRNKAERLRLDEDYLQLDIPNGKKIRAESVVLDDIFPKRIGTLTTVSPDWLTVTDSSLDFDLNGQRIDGQKAYVSFTSGECSGKDFEIDSYNHATKTIKLLPITDKDGYAYPNATFEIKAGDKYIFYGIIMPQTYFSTAEADLKQKGIELLNQSQNTPPPYAVDVDEKYMRDNGIQVNAGDRIRLKDSAMSIDKIIRVSSVEFPLVNPNKVSFVISDIIPLNVTEKAIVDINKTKRDNVTVNKTNAELARLNMLDIERLKAGVFDPDGYFDPERIKPFSIETYMLSVGAKSQNFALNSVFIDANTNGNPNHLTVSQGSLIHYQIDIEGLGYIWLINGAEFVALDPIKQYYLSAKCSKTGLTGDWVLSETPIKVDDEPGFYHFNVGLIYPVINGSRGHDFTNGMTFILGDQITTGTIKSLDGLNFINLTTGEFNLGDATSGLDYGISAPDTLTIRGEIVANDAKFINLIVQNLKTKVTGKRVEISEFENNIKIIDALNKILVLIDDDAAIVGYRVNHDPPYNVIPVYGAGIMIGDVSGEYLSLATNGIDTNGNLNVGGLGSFGSYVAAKHYQSWIYQGVGSLPEVGLVLATGNCNLYTYPTHGQLQTVKNRTAGNITVSAAETSGRGILDQDNDNVINITLSSGSTAMFQYYQPDNVWVLLNQNNGLSKRIAYSYKSSVYHIDINKGSIVADGSGE